MASSNKKVVLCTVLLLAAEASALSTYAPGSWRAPIASEAKTAAVAPAVAKTSPISSSGSSGKSYAPGSWRAATSILEDAFEASSTTIVPATAPEPAALAPAAVVASTSSNNSPRTSVSYAPGSWRAPSFSAETEKKAVEVPPPVVAATSSSTSRSWAPGRWRAVSTSAPAEIPPESSSTSAVDELLSVLCGNGKPAAADIVSLIAEVEARTNSPLDTAHLKGDWQQVFQQNSKDATNSQKVVGKTGLTQYSNFITDDEGKDIFRNIVKLTKRRFSIVADVEYEPSADNPRQLTSMISKASVEVNIGKRFGMKPLRIPLPLKGNGWLEVTHLSENMRITRGSRGGLFVHVRPSLVAP